MITMTEEQHTQLKRVLEPDYPLQIEFRAGAPGTFKHCQQVANIMENVASERGLDILLARAAALYHDVGKINNPMYFAENQQNGDPNPHDKLTANAMYQYLTRHVADTVLILLNDGEFPWEVLDIVSRHHGDTVLYPSYQKAQSEEEAVDEANFRYKCKKPNGLYSSILMIVDAAEATARSLYNSGQIKSKEDIDAVVAKTITRLQEDQQLDEMKVGDVRAVSDTLRRELQSIFLQKRPSYDIDDEKKSGDPSDKREEEKE